MLAVAFSVLAAPELDVMGDMRALAETSSGSGSGSGMDPPPAPAPVDNPCFAAATTTACKLFSDISAAEAHRQCYTIKNTKSTGAALALMKTLTAGDVVLAADAAGVLSLDRVVVNQHKANVQASALIELHHSAGVLALTPDHVLLVEGVFAPARDAKPGSSLTLADGKAAVVERVAATHGDVINPVTAGGTIVADGVVAAAHPEWSFPLMKAFPLFFAASGAFPETTQAYYEAMLEPLIDTMGAQLQPVALGATSLVAPAIAADVAAVLGLAIFAGATPALAAMLVAATLLRKRKA